MLELSPETEALVRSLAAERQLSVDMIVRDALLAQSKGLVAAGERGTDRGAQDLALRRVAFLRDFAGRLSTSPDRDPRSAKEIMDDLNPL